MRSPGVPNFPDPGAGGVNLNGTGINPSSPAFEAAQATCNKLLPGSGPAPQQASEQQKEQLIAISECMRSHGVTGFPDPTTTPPTGSQDYSIIQGVASNLFLLVPDTINVDFPAFKQAAEACSFGVSSFQRRGDAPRRRLELAVRRHGRVAPANRHVAAATIGPHGYPQERDTQADGADDYQDQPDSVKVESASADTHGKPKNRPHGD